MEKDYLKSIREGQTLHTSEQIKLILSLALPAMLANVSSILMQYIDSSMVGRLGANDSASIGLVSTSTWLFGSMCLAFPLGFTVQVAQRIGAKDFAAARKIMVLGYKVSLVLVTFLTVIGLAIANSLPHWLGGADEICQNASYYFGIYAAALPLVLLRYTSSAMLQATGNMRLPSILNTTMCILDVVFNYVFIFALGFGVAGAALGTAMSELVTAILMLYALLLRPGMLGIFAKDNNIIEGVDISKEDVQINNVSVMKKAAMISLPVAAESVVTCGAQITTTVIVAPLGSYSIAANSFSVTVESLCYMPCYGIGAAATTMIGQSIGAGREEMAKKLGWLLIWMTIAIMIVTGTGMFIFAPALIGLLSPVEQIRTLGSKILRIEAFAEPLYGTSIVAGYIFRGAQDTFVPTLFNLITLWSIRIPMSAYLAPRVGLTGVWIAMAIELSVRGMLFLIRMKRKWS